MQMKKFLILGLSACLMTSACAPSTATRGNYLYADDVAMIKPFTSSKLDVLNTLGSPTAKAVFDDQTWYYVGLKTEKKAFFDEKVTERQTFKVTFNESDFVETIEQVENDPVNVPDNDRITPTSGNEVTILQQILGNIGKFNPPSDGGGLPGEI